MQCNSGMSVIDIDKRRTELLELSSYIQTVDNDVTMILQSLQWDRRHLIEAAPLISCKYDRNHRVPQDKMEAHEKECYLRSLGYSKEDLLLPEPLDVNAKTLVTLSKNDVQNIIEYAAKVDPTFKKGRGSKDPSELSLERLQRTYSADERRAIHDAVVSAAPSCHDLSELALPSGDGETQNTKAKSRAEIIAELRDMKRRRAKYRGAVKTRNYSDELRSVIATQMEHYSEALGASTKTNDINKSNIERSKDFREVQVKKEPLESDQAYASEKEKRRMSSREYDHYRDKITGETREKSKDHRREKYKDETRYPKENYRDERHSDRRDKYTEREQYDDYRRDRDDRRHKNDRDRHSSSSKDRSRDRSEYRTNDKYSDSKRNYKDYKPSRNSERRYKDTHEKYKEEKHKRYYDYKQEYDLANKRIKQEKDRINFIV
ncbi:RNA-binding protein 25-like [Cydia fagiglandana]|uniref:RNA-binding protein 25-like n=1 Tax=Cydia fagiglandana TaxID=1458189 RepID=UPI002FEDE98D